ncbi:hypothetical protein IWW49_005135, partial [Coemansia sp. RSA 1797]
GLTYEIQRGDYSVGSNVRDAACYVMWSLARIPNPSSKRVFAEMSVEMATTLISVAVFDRESNVRRAASAAFQEHVGRQVRKQPVQNNMWHMLIFCLQLLVSL